MSKKDHKKEKTFNWGNEANFPGGILDRENGIIHVQFRPMSLGHEFQELMTKKFHELIMEYSDMTMAEMGFMHQISVAYENGRIRVRMYFNPELATVKRKTANNKYELAPLPELSIMNGFFFIARNPEELGAIMGFEEILAPKSKIEFNTRGNKYLRIKKSSTELKKQDALYIECNYLLTVASIMNIRLDDPNYTVSIETLGQTDNKKKAVMLDGKENNHPVWIRVTYTAPDVDDTFVGYNPQDAIPFLTSMIETQKKSRDYDRELGRKIADKSEKKKKKADGKTNKKFISYC